MQTVFEREIIIKVIETSITVCMRYDDGEGVTLDKSECKKE